ncbi:MAG: serine--tRNA ligase [Phycisphaerales bacterium JB039]
MIDLRRLREDPEHFKQGARHKGVTVDIDRAVDLDRRIRELQTRRDEARANQNRLARESGPKIGQLMGQLKKAEGGQREALQAELDQLKQAPQMLKAEVQAAEDQLAQLEPEFRELLLAIPLPPDPDVPVGAGAEDNVELRRWAPAGFDPAVPFAEQRGFAPKTHIELVESLGLCDFERGVKLAGSRSYSLTGDGMRLHQAILRYAFDFMAERHGFRPMSVPALVREEAMVGTGFFPAGREQTYQVEETRRGAGEDLYLAGTGEVGLMGLHAGEILDEADLPLRYVTWSPCYRREAGAAGKDTAGLYRIHQFEKVEQVVVCGADEAESRAWHQKMIGYVEALLQSLELPYRLLQCCTGDLGVKNADMIDIECWMPGRGEVGADGRPTGDFGETHSASRLYDFQCRRLNMRYRAGGEGGTGSTTFCHSLNNTVAASPRILIPLLEMHQQADGTVRVPEALRPYMGGRERIG